MHLDTILRKSLGVLRALISPHVLLIPLASLVLPLPNTSRAAVPISPPPSPSAEIVAGSYIVTFRPTVTRADTQACREEFLRLFAGGNPGHGLTDFEIEEFRGFHFRARAAPGGGKEDEGQEQEEASEMLNWIRGREDVVMSVERDLMIEAARPVGGRKGRENARVGTSLPRLWPEVRGRRRDDGRGNGTEEKEGGGGEEGNGKRRENVVALETEYGRPWGIVRVSMRDRARKEVYQRLSRPHYDDDDGKDVDGKEGRQGGKKLKVYVVDSGVRTSHVDFLDSRTRESRVVWGKTFVPGGVNDDIDGHGTHIAGTIGGNVYGVQNKSTIVSLKVTQDGKGPVSGVISAISWAANDARTTNSTCIMNLSLGLQAETGCTGALIDAGKAAREQGCLLVASAGNEGIPASLTSPACSADFMTVGAIEREGKDGKDVMPEWSNHGQAVDIFAPGTDVESASNEGDYGGRMLGGTSMASPHIAGLAAYFSSLFGITDGDELRVKILGVATVGKVDDLGTNSKNRLAYNANCEKETWGGYFCEYAALGGGKLEARQTTATWRSEENRIILYLNH
ncbi:hypothetical protein MKZ38_003354 [Zalerion maritima]|uniref:Peptidase S8/S53 domain-containing protein n=1 Tax=Zalerion maritima TaxID=339359 RepID=A0AAD5RMS2_9PEZI|nr:hypothetical protein MKZ38_003354 [Zalerion maritima]